MFDNNLIISTKEARKILGKEYAKYSDEQITRMIKQLDSIAEAYIKSVPKY
jgi:Ca2+-binding EF-hand superfamily protein